MLLPTFQNQQMMSVAKGKKLPVRYVPGLIISFWQIMDVKSKRFDCLVVAAAATCHACSECGNVENNVVSLQCHHMHAIQHYKKILLCVCTKKNMESLNHKEK